MKTVEWCNLNKLESYKKLLSLKEAVSVKTALKGAAGAKRIADFSIPMSSGLAYNYAAKEVNRQILSIFKSLVKEASLFEKFSQGRQKITTAGRGSFHVVFSEKA